jgi:protocatechuate 3,4-dioxygenase beta subunit
MLGPFYTPGAPERDKVGEGYVISGNVLSANGCAPIPGAQIEVWIAGPDGEYRDDYRATFFAKDDGSYTFESHFPPPYSNRPPHHHFRISAAGFETLVTQHYPQPGETRASFDLVLIPSP